MAPVVRLCSYAGVLVHSKVIGLWLLRSMCWLERVVVGLGVHVCCMVGTQPLLSKILQLLALKHLLCKASHAGIIK